MKPAFQEIHALLQQKKLDLAEERLVRLQTEFANHPDRFYLLGVLHFMRGQYSPAAENLKRCLDLDVHHTDAAICLSVLFNDFGKYDEGKRIFSQANQSVVQKKVGDPLGIDSKFAVKHLELADLYFRYRRYEEAIEQYTKAIELEPTSFELRIRRAKAFAKKGFTTRAIQDLQSLKNEHPRFIPARIQLGLLHFSQNNVLDAELEWESILEIDPQNREVPGYLEMAKKARLLEPARQERPLTPSNNAQLFS